jgi:hypothetical protein
MLGDTHAFHPTTPTYVHGRQELGSRRTQRFRYVEKLPLDLRPTPMGKPGSARPLPYPCQLCAALSDPPGQLWRPVPWAKDEKNCVHEITLYRAAPSSAFMSPAPLPRHPRD